MSQFWEKLLTKGWMNEQMDGRTNELIQGKIIGPIRWNR